MDGAVCARVGGFGALELAQSKRRRAHTNTCELQTSSTLDTRLAVRLLDVFVVVSGVILVGTSCDLGGGLGGGHLCQVELQVRGRVEVRGSRREM